MKPLQAGQAAIVATVEPVMAGAIGVAPLREELTLPKHFGALLVLAGGALAQTWFEKSFKERVASGTPRRPAREDMLGCATAKRLL